MIFFCCCLVRYERFPPLRISICLMIVDWMRSHHQSLHLGRYSLSVNVRSHLILLTWSMKKNHAEQLCAWIFFWYDWSIFFLQIVDNEENQVSAACLSFCNTFELFFIINHLNSISNDRFSFISSSLASKYNDCIIA